MKKLMFVFLLLPVQALFALDFYPAASGSYEEASTWNGGDGSYPDGTTDHVTFGTGTPGEVSIDVNGNHTLGSLNFGNWNAFQLTFQSGDENTYTLNIEALNLSTPFTLVVGAGIVLEVNETTSGNGGNIIVRGGGKLIMKQDVVLGGAGAHVTIDEGGKLLIEQQLVVNGGSNILDIAGEMVVKEVVATDGSQEININSGGTLAVLEDINFSGAASFDVDSEGEFGVYGDVSMSGGTSGSLDGSMNIAGNIDMNYGTAIDGDGSIHAGSYSGGGTIFGTAADDLENDSYYQGGGDSAIYVNPLAVYKLLFAEEISGEVNLNWVTESEHNNQYFVVQRSTDSLFFENIHTTEGAGTSTDDHYYEHIDIPDSAGVYYYRLKAHAYSGVNMYSAKVAIEVGEGGGDFLPIELVSFTAFHVNNAIELQWITASESDNDYFTLERSEDGVSFEIISHEQGAGTTDEMQHYSYTDYAEVAGVYYYRLKQTDYDGTTTYSEVISVTVIPDELLANIKIWCAHKTLYVELSHEVQQMEVRLYNVQGNILDHRTVRNSSSFEMDLSRFSGIVLVSMQIEHHVITERVYVQ